MVTIHATREAYKKCGKDPSRYRTSGEALCRRILRGISLYQIDTLVDLINLVSIRYGYSIGFEQHLAAAVEIHLLAFREVGLLDAGTFFE